MAGFHVGEISIARRILKVGLFKAGCRIAAGSKVTARRNEGDGSRFENGHNKVTTGRGDHEAGLSSRGMGIRLVHRKQHQGSACEPQEASTASRARTNMPSSFPLLRVRAKPTSIPSGVSDRERCASSAKARPGLMSRGNRRSRIPVGDGRFSNISTAHHMGSASVRRYYRGGRRTPVQGTAAVGPLCGAEGDVVDAHSATLDTWFKIKGVKFPFSAACDTFE